ncbi:hypothetical protein F5Y02DRAFT_423906 [Annulohypoxylon stygium]|nr:hypothetical protein F5Y02DRAFT_423906 [Annulohypoxylon stygium]
MRELCDKFRANIKAPASNHETHSSYGQMFEPAEGYFVSVNSPICLDTIGLSADVPTATTDEIDWDDFFNDESSDYVSTASLYPLATTDQRARLVSIEDHAENTTKTMAQERQLIRWALADHTIRQHFPNPPQSELLRASEALVFVDDRTCSLLCVVILLLSCEMAQKAPPPPTSAASQVPTERLVNMHQAHKAPFEIWRSHPERRPSTCLDNTTKVPQRSAVKKRRRTDLKDLGPRKNRKHCARVCLDHVVYMEGSSVAQTFTWKRRQDYWQVTPEKLLEFDVLSLFYLREGEYLSIYVRPEAGDLVRMELQQPGDVFIGIDQVGRRKYRVSAEEIGFLLQEPGCHVDFLYWLYRSS